jgi:hypothetical protein
MGKIVIRRLFRILILLAGGCVFLSGGVGAQQGPGAWITGPLVKVSTTTAPGAAQSLQMSAAQNEFESFQVHAFATTNPIQMNVTVGDFTNAQTGTIIHSATNVFVYREAYLNITTLSDANGTPGVTPDILIPTVDPYFHEPRNAFPVTVPANQVQSAWIDVLVPTNIPSGSYTATVTVKDGTSPIATLSVSLTVWAFTLPSTATLKSAFGMSWNGLCVQAYGSYTLCQNYPGSGGNSDRAIELTHLSQAALLLDHRISISQTVYVGPPSGTWAQFDAKYGALMNGTAGTLLAGAKLTALEFTPPGADNLDAATIQDWVSHFTTNGWLGALFHYTCDEPPNGCSWANALTMEQTVYNASHNMKTLITTDLASATQNNLLADLSVIVPIVNSMDPQGGSNQRSTYDSWLMGINKHLWWYQSCSSHESCSNGTVGSSNATWPSYMVDATPVRNRVFEWFAFIDSIEAELYYQIDYCWTSGQCGPGGNASNPWSSVYAFGGNGDGTLIYPGTPALIGGTTPIALPSIRLKQIRDGMEDFEYLNALSQAGDDAFARSTAAAFITNAYTFDNDPQALTNARLALGNRLHQRALQVSPATNIATSGPQGGPFSPASFQYQLSATAGTVNYAISGIPSWLNANITSGPATTTPVTVTLSLINVGSLTPGAYTGTVTFANADTGIGNTTRTATLTVNASLSATPASGAAPLTVAFKTMVAEGDTNSYTVDFGDGTTSGAMAIAPSGIACAATGPCYSAIASTVHSYTSGSYTATLLNSALTGVATAAVVVSGSAPRVPPSHSGPPLTYRSAKDQVPPARNPPWGQPRVPARLAR